MKISSVHWRQQNSWLQVGKTTTTTTTTKLTDKQTGGEKNLEEGKPYSSVNVNLLLNQWNYFHHCRQSDAFHAVFEHKRVECTFQKNKTTVTNVILLYTAHQKARKKKLHDVHLKNYIISCFFYILLSTGKAGRQETHHHISHTLAGSYIAGGRGGRGGSYPRQENSIFFSNVVFEFAELFLVAILVRNYKQID